MNQKEFWRLIRENKTARAYLIIRLNREIGSCLIFLSLGIILTEIMLLGTYMLIYPTAYLSFLFAVIFIFIEEFTFRSRSLVYLNYLKNDLELQGIK